MKCPLLFPRWPHPHQEGLRYTPVAARPAPPGSVYTGCKELPSSLRVLTDSDPWDDASGKRSEQGLETGTGIWPGNSRLTWTVF